MINKNTTYLFYLKYPPVPIMDYYYDANGQYQYLDEGEDHVWLTGETDADGNSYTPGTTYSSKTIELGWKDSDKIDIASRVLGLIGVNLDMNSVMQYAEQLKYEV